MIPDQVYLWGWPQWAAIALLGGGAVMMLRDRLDHFGDPDRAMLKLVLLVLWTILLGAGGFWS